jgi:DNA polymerase-1
MQIEANHSEAYRLLHEGTLALARAERQGMRVDMKYIRKQKGIISKQINELEDAFHDSNFFQQWDASTKKDININSSVQLRDFLYKIQGREPPKLTDKGFGSVDEESLQALNIDELDDLLKVRKLKKIRDTYLDQYSREQVDGVIHPFYNLNLVRTFRSSCDRPNLQNVPKREEEAMKLVRGALFPRPGHQLLEVDYSGLEVRIGACYHKDPKMISYIKNKQTDMHRDMMEEIFMLKYDKLKEHDYLRDATKNGFVFPQFYGDYFVNNARDMAVKWGELPNGVFKNGAGVAVDNNGTTLGTHLRANGIKSIKTFENHLEKIQNDFWAERFPVYDRWKRKWWTLYKRRGYIDMFTGFRCKGLMSRNDATNYPIQGSAFHCLLWSFIELDRILRHRNFNTKLIGQIHDAILFDVHPDELDDVAEIVYAVTTEALPKAWEWIIVPLDVKAEICPVDGSWAEKEHFQLR